MHVCFYVLKPTHLVVFVVNSAVFKFVRLNCDSLGSISYNGLKIINNCMPVFFNQIVIVYLVAIAIEK